MAEHTEMENRTVLREFREAVNLSAQELADWLETSESQSVGIKQNGDDESTGHASGRRIVELLKKSDYTEEDYGQMRRVVSYVHRHLAQRPDGDIEHTRWRYSLKNWGHEPLEHRQPRAQSGQRTHK